MAIKELSYEIQDRDYKIVVKSVNECFVQVKRRRPKLIKTSDPHVTFLVASGSFPNFTYWVSILYDETPVAAVQFTRNRDIEKDLKRHAKLNSQVYSPHADVLKDFQRKGYVSTVYAWFLSAGHTLSTSMHTHAASKVWKFLGRHFDLRWWDWQTKEFTGPSETFYVYPVLFGKKA